MWSKRYKVGYIASVVTLNFLIFGLMYTSISRMYINRGVLGGGRECSLADKWMWPLLFCEVLLSLGGPLLLNSSHSIQAC
jgi:hypothetical protein